MTGEKVQERGNAGAGGGLLAVGMGLGSMLMDIGRGWKCPWSSGMYISVFNGSGKGGSGSVTVDVLSPCMAPEGYN